MPGCSMRHASIKLVQGGLGDGVRAEQRARGWCTTRSATTGRAARSAGRGQVWRGGGGYERGARSRWWRTTVPTARQLTSASGVEDAPCRWCRPCASRPAERLDDLGHRALALTSASVTSQATTVAPFPASLAALTRRSCRRARNATGAPLSARPIPMHRPNPAEAPTTATRSTLSDIEFRAYRTE